MNNKSEHITSEGLSSLQSTVDGVQNKKPCNTFKLRFLDKTSSVFVSTHYGCCNSNWQDLEIMMRHRSWQQCIIWRRCIGHS